MKTILTLCFALFGCMHTVVIDDRELGDAMPPLERTDALAGDSGAPSADAAHDAGDASHDAPSPPDAAVVDSGVDTGIDSGVSDSGVVVDSGVALCFVNNYAPRDCVSMGQDFYVVESCGMNCWTTTPCLQKMPHCPNGDTCEFLNGQNQVVKGVCK
jgi:hypothetical protein